ncbi:unnamed protein product, partial [Iphiclides podalirius]
MGARVPGALNASERAIKSALTPNTSAAAAAHLRTGEINSRWGPETNYTVICESAAPRTKPTPRDKCPLIGRAAHSGLRISSECAIKGDSKLPARRCTLILRFN